MGPLRTRAMSHERMAFEFQVRRETIDLFNWLPLRDIRKPFDWFRSEIYLHLFSQCPIIHVCKLSWYRWTVLTEPSSDRLLWWLGSISWSPGLPDKLVEKKMIHRHGAFVFSRDVYIFIDLQFFLWSCQVNPRSSEESEILVSDLFHWPEVSWMMGPTMFQHKYCKPRSWQTRGGYIRNLIVINSPWNWRSKLSKWDSGGESGYVETGKLFRGSFVYFPVLCDMK